MSSRNANAIALGQKWLKVVLLIALISTAIISIGNAYFWDYSLELLSNFRVYYYLIAVMIAIACIVCQIWGWRLKQLFLYIKFFGYKFSSLPIAIRESIVE